MDPDKMSGEADFRLLSTSFSAAADCLFSEKQTIFTLWEKGTRKFISPETNLETRVLVNAIPGILEGLEVAIREKTVASLPAIADVTARIQDRQRVGLAEYPLDQIVSEHRILREITIRTLEQHGVLTSEIRDLVLEVIVLFMSNVGKAHLEIQQQKADFERTRLEAVIEQLPVAVWLADAQSRQIVLGNSLSRVLIRQPAEMSRRFDDYSEFQVFHLDGRPLDVKEWPLARALDQKEVVSNQEIRIVKPDGTPGVARFNAAPILDKKGHVISGVAVGWDITESKRDAESLRRLKEELELITDVQPTLISYINPDYTYKFINETYTKWFRRSRSSIIGKKVIDVIGKKAFDQIKPAVDRALYGEKVTLESQIHFQDAGSRFVQVTFLPDKDVVGEIRGYFVSVVDQTIQKETENALRQSEIRYRTLMELAPQVIFTTSPQGEVSFASATWFSFTGMSSDSDLRSAWASVIHPSDHQVIEECWQKARTVGSLQGLEFRILRRDGQYIWFSSKAHPVRDENGEVIEWVGVATDIQSQKDVQHQLEISRHQLQSILDYSPSLIYLKDLQGHHLVSNRELTKKLEAEKDFLHGKTDAEIFPPEVADSVWSHDLEVIQTQKPQEFEETLRLVDRDHTYISAKFPVLDSSGSIVGIGSVSTDITERKKSELEIKKTVAQLRELQELRERFVAMLTHDLRSPLSAAKMSAELALEQLNNPDLLQRLLPRIGKSIDRIDRMITDLLDVNRINAGETLPMQIQRCDLRESIRASVDELAQVQGERFDLLAEGDLIGYWSADGIRRVVDNLLSNAVKYGDPKTRITIRLRRLADRVRVSVHNFGNPLKAQDCKQIFEPFRRLKQADASPQFGWGIGLTLVKGIVISHGGEISVESSPDLGTTFTVELPVDCRKDQKINPAI